MRTRHSSSVLALVIGLLLIVSACTTDNDNAPASESEHGGATTDVPGAIDSSPTAETVEEGATSTPGETPKPTEETSARADDVGEEDLPFWRRWWEDTDFDNRTVPLEEIESGGVSPDGIPPIDEPEFIDFDEADEWLGDNEPVIALEVAGEARAYPLQILTWHEIVNDEIGDRAVAVTFCPLCNSSVAFDREVEGHGVVRFGVSGLLRNSDLIMWDDKTESLWQQITGEAIVGELAGEKLTTLSSVIVSYEAFTETYPGAVVLSRDTGHERTYGNNPYEGYDNIESSPFLYEGEHDDRYPPMERVVALEIAGEAMAYPFSQLEDHPVVHDEVGGAPVVIFWKEGTVSALDSETIADSQDVGAANAFSPVLNGEELTFTAENGDIVDEETGSTWNTLGQATSGELEGEQLDTIVNGTYFWFAWSAFKPETGLWSPE